MNALPPFAWTKFTIAPAIAKDAWPAIINRVVNEGIDPASGPTPTPADEVWLIWPRVGWCHDYALTKRYELMLRGYEARECLLAEVQLPDGEYHLVLVVNGATLDNIRSEIRPWPQYKPIKMQSVENPNFWVAL
jgi:predicted transglutaminase-like cysteine proteinase